MCHIPAAWYVGSWKAGLTCCSSCNEAESNPGRAHIWNRRKHCHTPPYLLWWTCRVQRGPRPYTELRQQLRGNRRTWYKPRLHCPPAWCRYGDWKLWGRENCNFNVQVLMQPEKKIGVNKLSNPVNSLLTKGPIPVHWQGLLHPSPPETLDAEHAFDFYSLNKRRQEKW